MVKYVLIFLLSVFIASVSQILLKKSTTIERKNKLFEYLNKYVISSYILLFISTILTLCAYKGVKLSIGMVLETISYILVPVLSFLFLKEKISKRQVFAMVLIIVGILVYSFF